MSQPTQMAITANGESYEVQPGTTLVAFLESRGLKASRVVVERNGQALTPAAVRETTLERGDRLEIVRIVAGG